ncbi:MAG TPA: DUF853 family protein [Candidatus Ventrimonas merdavium]|nr:DUF853 family protein [Candidatus Ventrimonas merdavium]
MYQDGKLLIGKAGEKKIFLYPKMANRHGMIAGATGTGKTVTLKVLAESFSDCGVPVFLADVKGDLAGMCREGEAGGSVQERIEAMGLEVEGFRFRSYPVTFWDVYGEKGLPLRTTISEMGPLLLSRILDLNDTQSDVLTVVFKIADDEGLLLIDTKDLKSMLQYVGDRAKEYALEYGSLPRQSLSAIVRAVVALEAQGAEQFFGEPALSIGDWLGTDCDGRGKIQILDCQKLINNPTMYATFLLWMMSELFETLPEAGDRAKPKMVFFFDEAHLLFDHASKELVSKVEQVVKLIRSKGVGIYFITQSPSDIPDGVLSQLGNKVQHALRAYTPKEQKALKAAAGSFRENPELDTYEALGNLGIGEALVSVLDEDGVPTMVERCAILPPQSQMGAIEDEERERHRKEDLLYSRYVEMIDRDSAYEFLQRKAPADADAEAAQKQEEAARKAAEKEAEAARKAAEKEAEAARKAAEKEAEAARKAAEKEAEAARKAAEKAEAAREKQVRSTIGKVASTAAGTVGRQILGDLGGQLGGSFGKRLGGNVGASLGRGILSTLFKR